MGAILVPEKVSFERKGQHAFDKPIKLVAKELETIIEKLLKLAASPDEKVAERACSKLLDYHMNMVEARDKDEIMRKMAQLKLPGGGGNLVPDDRPTVDFNTIQTIT